MEDRSEYLEAAVHDLNMRILWLEKLVGVPMSVVDRIIADEAYKRRRAPSEMARRCMEAGREAMAEAERVGHRGPIDRFVRRLKAGEFDQASTSTRIGGK
jgi:hypothetical protein